MRLSCLTRVFCNSDKFFGFIQCTAAAHVYPTADLFQIRSQHLWHFTCSRMFLLALHRWTVFFSKNNILCYFRASFVSELKQHFEDIPGDHVVFIGHAVLPLFLCISLHRHLNALLRLGHYSVFAVGLRIFPSTFSQIKHIGCATFVSRFFSVHRVGKACFLHGLNFSCKQPISIRRIGER